MGTYRLQNRYQDEGWSDLSGETFDHWPAADDRARLLSRDAIRYGMVRVVGPDGPVVAYPAGGGTPRSCEGSGPAVGESFAPPRPATTPATPGYRPPAPPEPGPADVGPEKGARPAPRRGARVAACFAAFVATLAVAAAIGDGALVGHVAGWAAGLWSMAWIRGGD